MKNSRLSHGALGGIWLVLSFVSVNHVVRMVNIPFLSVTILGLLGWITILLTLVVLSYRFWRQAVIVFVLFCSFGVWFGPFLEPPADPLEHLRRTLSSCEKRADDLPEKNFGFWHYSMSAVVLCTDFNKQSVDVTILKLNILHGVYQGILLVGLFILAKSTGLPDRWAFLSCCISFLFFGTNRFSFFSYYSFAPTFSSILLCWLWTALFFFRKNWQSLVTGICAALIVLPILWVNHVQEAFFLGLLVFVWLSLNIHEYLWKRFKKDEASFGGKTIGNWFYFKVFRYTYLLSVFLVFFVLPQWDSFRNFVSFLFVRNLWEANQKLVFSWMDLHLLGKVWGFRISESFSFVGVVVMFLAIPFFCPAVIRKNNDKKVRVFLLAILPLIGYCIPLIHFVWVSNVFVRDYWRLSYLSMYWVFFAYFLWGLEGRIVWAIKQNKK